MQSKSQAGEALNIVTRCIGFPTTLIPDNAGEHMVPQKELQEFILRYHIDYRTTKPYSPWQNRSRGMIKILKDKAKYRIMRRRVTKRVRDFGLVWEAEIYSRTAKNMDEPLWKY